MGVFFAYILKSAVCLACFYLFYRWLLSRETFHRFNRIALLGILLVSLLIPFIEVTVKEQTEVNQTVLTIEQLLMMASLSDTPLVAVAQPEEISLSWIQIGGIVYLVGIFFFACRNLYSLCRMCLLLKSGKREKMDKKVTLIVHEQDVSPFSWMKYIVISRKDLEENGREILIHERAHILNRHSWDLLVADICIFFQWFNPGAWLLKQELQNIHEYEADETVLKEGVDAKQYQLLLIKKAVGTRLYSMANSFNHSKLKKRITMMLKEKSNPWARLKYLYVLPLAAIAVTAFARPEVSKTVEEISALKVNELASLVEAKVAENISPVMENGDEKAVKQSKNATYTFVLGQEKGMEQKKDSSVTRELNIVINGVEFKGKPLILVNGKNVDYEIFKALNSKRVKDLRTITDKKDLVKYGKKAENGVVEVTLYTDQELLNTSGKIMSVHVDNGLNFGKKEFNLSTSNPPLVIVDGKEMSLSELKPESIESFTILKDNAAVSIYGEKGKNGVVLVTLKNGDITATAEKIEINVSPVAAENMALAKGIVKDADGNPVVGAIVMADGTKVGVVTGSGGRFTLQVPKDTNLIFSYVGMKTVKSKAAPDMVILMGKE